MKHPNLLLHVAAAVVIVKTTTSLTWKPEGIQDGSKLQHCVGDVASLPWTFEASPAESVTSIQWYKNTGTKETLVASYVDGQFLKTPSVETSIEFLLNAGIRILHVAEADFGTYTVRVNGLNGCKRFTESQTVTLSLPPETMRVESGHLNVEVLPEVVLYEKTGEHHARLACGRFTRAASTSDLTPLVTVTWETPTEGGVSSTANSDGRFFLDLLNPVQGGQYTCYVQVSPLAQCVNSSGFVIPQSGHVVVNAEELRFLVLEAENTNLRKALNNYRHESQRVQTKLEKHLDEVSKLTSTTSQQLQSVKSSVVSLTSQAGEREQSTKRAIDEVTRAINELAYVPYVFTAKPQKSRLYANGDVVLFDEVLADLGSIYDVTTGIGTVPVDGVYVASLRSDPANGRSESDEKNVDLHLFINGSRKMTAWGERGVPGSVSSVLKLKAGDRIEVKADAWVIDNSGKEMEITETFETGCLFSIALMRTM